MILFKLINSQTGEVIIDIKSKNKTELKKEIKQNIKSLELDCRIYTENLEYNEIEIINSDGDFIAVGYDIDKDLKVESIKISYSTE